MSDLYDSADQALQQANQEAEERAVAFVRKALEQGGNEADAHAVCWLAGLPWRDVQVKRC